MKKVSPWSGKKNLIQKSKNPLKVTEIKKKTVVALSLCFMLLSLKNLPAQTNDDCLTCHSDEELTKEIDGKEVSVYVNENQLLQSAHKNLECISCHTGFDMDELPHKENITPIDCESCHKDAPIKHSFHPQFLLSKQRLEKNGTSCKTCHGKHNVISPEEKKSAFNRTNIVEGCGNCHKDEKSSYTNSLHYKGFKEKISGAPDCLTCHNKEGIVSTKKIKTADLKINQTKLCLSCHLDNPEVRKRTAPSTGFILSYEKSIHGSEVLTGKPNAANCVDCHTAHQVNNASVGHSTINRSNIPNTCGRCHSSIKNDFELSVHGQAIQNGNVDAPVCTTCHGEHLILKHTDKSSPVSYENLSEKVCAKCHASEKLAQKFGISDDRFKTFEDSYHGLAIQGGSIEVANCASCHGTHKILSAENPLSTVNKNNLVKTCGKCHPGANKNFTVGKIHITMTDKKEPILELISSVYIILIITIIGGMFFHNTFDLIKKAKIKRLKQRGIIKREHYGHSLYLRMTVSERIQHLLLMISFIILVVTGFMLQYPNAWWVVFIKNLSNKAFEIRGLLHRIAAVVMVVDCVYHILYISFTERGKNLIKDLLPTVKDFKDAIGVAKFNLGITNIKPKLDRFGYVEKAEYWALVWGTILMTATGIVLWFDNTFIGLLTKLGVDIARLIHFYEAWLALLSIIVWHIYFVIFNPDIYPMNLAWIKGYISEEEMAEEHPLELEKIKHEQTDSNM